MCCQCHSGLYNLLLSQKIHRSSPVPRELPTPGHLLFPMHDQHLTKITWLKKKNPPKVGLAVCQTCSHHNMMAFTFATNSSLVAWLSRLRVLSEVHPSRQGKETGECQTGGVDFKVERGQPERGPKGKERRVEPLVKFLSVRWCSGQILRKCYLFVFCDDSGIFVMLKGLQESSAFRDTC